MCKQTKKLLGSEFRTGLKLKNKILLGFAKNEPWFIVEDKNHVSYRKKDRENDRK